MTGWSLVLGDADVRQEGARNVAVIIAMGDVMTQRLRGLRTVIECDGRGSVAMRGAAECRARDTDVDGGSPGSEAGRADYAARQLVVLITRLWVQ